MASQKQLELFLSGFKSQAIKWLSLAQYGSGLAPKQFQAEL
jgi:hypothetical protein